MTNKNKKGAGVLRVAAPSLIAVLIGLVVGIIVIIATNPGQAGSAIPNFFSGPFLRGLAGFGDLLYHMTPLLFTGLSVAFGYQTGLFNIGASGQFLVGGFLAILVSAKLETRMDPSIVWIIAFLIAGIGGALMGAIVGALKAYRNVNEVITSIMLNYSAMYVVNYLIKELKIYNDLKNETINLSTQIPKMGLDKIFPGTIAGGGFILGLIAVVIIYIILKKTTFGFELKGVGLNRHAAKYAGVNENKAIILSMAIAGALAGFGGSAVYLSGAGNHLTVHEVIPQEGFDGIAIALLGINEPVGVLLASGLISYLKMGGQAIQTLGYSPELITIIISFILYISALSVLFKRILSKKDKNGGSNINAETVENTTAPNIDKTDELVEGGDK